MFKLSRLTLASLLTSTTLLIASTAQAGATMANCSLWAHWDQVPATTAVLPPNPSPPMTTPCPGFELHPAIMPLLITTDNLSWEITLPNFIDDLPIKKIWIEVMTQFPKEEFDISVVGFDPTVGGGTEEIPGVSHGKHDLISSNPGAIIGFMEHFWILPNPDSEIITINFVPDLHLCPVTCSSPNGIPHIDAIWVHTISTVPEPGTLALFGLGLAGLGFARRKKAA